MKDLITYLDPYWRFDLNPNMIIKYHYHAIGFTLIGISVAIMLWDIRKYIFKLFK